MSIPKSLRFLFALAVASLLLNSLVLAKDKPPASPSPKPPRVAVLPIVNQSGDPGAVKILDDVLRDQFKAMGRERGTFLMPADVERILTAHEALDRSYLITERWGKTNTLDSTAVGGLDSLLNVDDILCVKVTDWETNVVHQIGAGQSSTTVGLGFALYDIRTKKLLWKKTPRQQQFAQEVDPSSGQITYDNSGNIQTKSAIEAPKVQEVADDVVRDAFKKFPEK